MTEASSEGERRGGLRWGAWQPFTGRGLAAFATASAVRLAVFQLLFAGLAAFTLLEALHEAWLPVLDRAIAVLPAAPAEISGGRLQWPDSEVKVLAEGPHLALAVDPNATGDLGQNGDLQLEFRANQIRWRGILGQTTTPYPLWLELPLDHNGAVAAWGAWRLPSFALVSIACVLGLLVTWWALGLCYAPLTLVMGWLLGRQLSPLGAWKLATAALLPASLWADVGLVGYAKYWIGLPGLVAWFALHFLAGWIALAWGIARLPHRATCGRTAPNPFDNAPASTSSTARPKARNPFNS